MKRHQRFLEEAARCEIATADDKKLKLHPESLMNWANPERMNNLGSIFVWELQGQPIVIGTVFTYDRQGVETWKLALHSLSDGPLTAKTEGGVPIWSPKQPGITWRSFPDAPDPAGSERLRLVQMRGLARQFQVTLTDNAGSDTPLRLLPQPVWRYSSPQHGVKDGAIIGWMIATDVEAFLLVELTDAGQWRYAFARFHFWKLRAELDGALVWEASAEPEQAYNVVGAPQFQSRSYSTMRIPTPQ